MKEIVKSKLFAIKWHIVIILLAGACIGVVMNLSVNHTPSPQATLAAVTSTPTPKNTPTPTPSPKPTPTLTPTPTPSYSIKGKVFIDTNGNGKDQSDDSNYTNGATISATLNGSLVGTTQSLNTGKFTLSGLQNGTYTLTLTVPDTYRVTTDNPIMALIDNNDNSGVKFGIIPTLWNIPSSEKIVFCRDLRSFVKSNCD